MGGTQSFFQNVFPTAKGYKLPPSYYAIKKTFKTIGLGYESIHACVNDCFLFRGDANKDVHFCPVCNTSRWKDSNTPGKKVPKKVLRYFPIIPRLQRLYKSSHTAKEMTWHATGKCTEPGKMQHPVDGRAWKDFDTKYLDFAAEPRNVRLGLAADGFNPFGNLSQSYSMWPVILTTYNLPPWLCMKESSFMLTLLIPGPKSPGKDIDVYLRPLIDDLKVLWAKPGVETIDVATGLKFNMRAMVLWTINDFPARSSLSGWSGQGYKACPTCNEDTPSVRVLGKTAYVGHRRFLKKPHKWRRSLEFNGETENGDPPREFSRDAIMTQLARLPTRVKGKHPRFGGVKIKRNVLVELNWTKRSIFYELEYWSFHTLKHNLDVMHIEKNVLESILNTLLMNDKSKDTAKARQDLKSLGIRSGLWLGQNKNGKCSKPQAAYSFTPADRKKFCQFIKGVKLPDGFGSNFKHKVTDNDTNITGLKSHDCHIMMQRLLPYGLQQYLPPDVAKPLIELCLFFKQICSQTLMVDDMLKAQSKVFKSLCKLIGLRSVIRIDHQELKKVIWYVLHNSPEIDTYWAKFKRHERRILRLIWEAGKLRLIIRQHHVDNDPGVSESSELFVLACGPSRTPISVNSCVVNGVRFVVHNRDERRTTQNIGSCSPGPDGEMYYGQLEQILEFSYLSFKTVLFRVKWFDTSNKGHDDPDVIHVDNSSDLALSTSLNDLEIAALHIDGQSIDVDAPPDIIDVVDEDDDIIDEEDPIPHDLVDSDDEDLVNLDIDDGVNDVARGHGGDGGGDDRPPPYQIPTGCEGCLGNRGKGTRKSNLGGRRAGRMHTRQKTRNLGLKAITDKNGPDPIWFEFGDRETLMPPGDHAAHWANYPGELVRELPLHYPSWRQMPPERKAGVVAKIGFDLRLHMKSDRWPQIYAGIQQHLQKIYNGKKDVLKERYWVPKDDETYYVERIIRERPSHISEVDWNAHIAFWNDPKNLARAAQNKKNGQRAWSYADRDPGLLPPSEICM
ncbi:zinc finger, PHD-type containing protein [Tanacetum coccineum]|uniref:Zinc finger, PHD-type containing protein n=1 Tax=Tanacetum coccineum TaxID=301880 RepID=A0ABQ5CKG0_9ASTR